MNKQMNEQWWTQLTQEEIKLFEEDGIFNVHVVSQNEDADRIIEGQDDIGHTWHGTWYSGESLWDIRWKEV